MKDQYEKIRGRFVLVKETAGEKVVGFVGSLWADDLRPYEVEYIRAWYSIPSGASVEKLEHCDGTSLPAGNFNNFLRFAW